MHRRAAAVVLLAAMLALVPAHLSQAAPRGGCDGAVDEQTGEGTGGADITGGHPRYLPHVAVPADHGDPTNPLDDRPAEYAGGTFDADLVLGGDACRDHTYTIRVYASPAGLLDSLLIDAGLAEHELLLEQSIPVPRRPSSTLAIMTEVPDTYGGECVLAEAIVTGPDGTVLDDTGLHEACEGGGGQNWK
jgi:hypothetical protein